MLLALFRASVLAFAAVTHLRGRRVDLRGKTAVVCGASRGLGLAIAKRLSAKGCRVAICARTAEDLEAARAEIHGAVYAEACDLRSARDAAAFLGNVERMLGPVDILVANAATITVAPLEALTADDFHEAIETTFYTALHAALAVVSGMRKRRSGTIALVASIGGKIGVPHLGPYTAAKFAEVGFAEVLRAETAKDGIHVLTITPGLMRTGSHVHVTVKGDAEKEYAWFGASATAPVIAIDADLAARKIVRAIELGRDRLAFTPEARLAARTHDLFPGLWSKAMALTAALLPKAPKGRGREAREGIEIERTSASKALKFVKERGAPLAAKHLQS